jgi:hypothetical protein
MAPSQMFSKLLYLSYSTGICPDCIQARYARNGEEDASVQRRVYRESRMVF